MVKENPLNSDAAFNRHLARENRRGNILVAVVLAGLLAFACFHKPGLNDRQQGEAENIAHDVFSDRIGDLESRVEELELRLSE